MHVALAAVEASHDDGSLSSSSSSISWSIALGGEDGDKQREMEKARERCERGPRRRW